MYICPNCKTQSEQFANFCSQCGTQMVYAEPQPVEPQTELLYQPVEQEQAAPFYPPQQPAYPSYAPAYTPPAYTPVNKPKLATKIVGMALSIAGLVFVAIGGLYTLFFSLLGEGVAAIVFSVVFDLFFIPLSIVGLCLSGKCINAGDRSTMSRVGKILGIVGIVIAGAALLIGIASAGMY